MAHAGGANTATTNAEREGGGSKTTRRRSEWETKENAGWEIVVMTCRLHLASSSWG